MRTDDLIRALVNDSGMQPEPVSRRFAILALLGVIAAACVFALTLTPRPDLSTVVTTPRVAFKFLVALTLVGTAGALALRAMRPDTEASLHGIVVPLLAVLGSGVAAELIASPPPTWRLLLIGSNAVACLSFVPLLSLLPLGALLAA